VAREYVAQLLHLGRADDALVVSSAIREYHPQDLTLLANHALVLLLAGQVDEARAAAATAAEADPADEITANLLSIIDRVIAGEVERPTRLPMVVED